MTLNNLTSICGACTIIAYFLGEVVAQTKQWKCCLKAIWTTLVATFAVAFIILAVYIDNGKVESEMNAIVYIILAIVLFFSSTVGMVQTVLLYKELPKNRNVRKIDKYIQTLNTRELNCLYQDKANVREVISKLEKMYKELADSTNLSGKMNQLITVIIPEYVKQYSAYSKTVSKFDTRNDTKVKMAKDMLNVSIKLLESIELAIDDQVHYTGVQELTAALDAFNADIANKANDKN